mgnify:CR=1 FL=1
MDLMLLAGANLAIVIVNETALLKHFPCANLLNWSGTVKRRRIGLRTIYARRWEARLFAFAPVTEPCPLSQDPLLAGQHLHGIGWPFRTSSNGSANRCGR